MYERHTTLRGAPKVLITGASRGIGRAISERLASDGYSVTGIARSADDVDFPGRLISCDLADEQATLDQLQRIRDEGGYRYLVNNFGSVTSHSLEDVTNEDLRTIFDLNVRTAVQTVQQLVPEMKASRFGRIVNISSRASHGVRDRTGYSAAKAALEACTKTWAIELASMGITSNAVSPGPIATDLLRQLQPEGSDAESRTIGTIPVGRLGTVNDVAAAVAFLLSDEAGFITGQILGVDGGASLVGRDIGNAR